MASRPVHKKARPPKPKTDLGKALYEARLHAGLGRERACARLATMVPEAFAVVTKTLERYEFGDTQWVHPRILWGFAQVYGIELATLWPAAVAELAEEAAFFNAHQGDFGSGCSVHSSWALDDAA